MAQPSPGQVFPHPSRGERGLSWEGGRGRTGQGQGGLRARRARQEEEEDTCGDGDDQQRGPLIRTVLYCTSSANSIPPVPSLKTVSAVQPPHAGNIQSVFLLTQTPSRIGDTAPTPPASSNETPLLLQLQQSITSTSRLAAVQHTKHTIQRILLVGVPGGSKWLPPPLHHLADSPESLNHAWWPVSPCTTHWPPPCSLERVSTDCWFRQSGSLHHKLRRPSQSRVGSRACYSVELPALQQDSRHHPS